MTNQLHNNNSNNNTWTNFAVRATGSAKIKLRLRNSLPLALGRKVAGCDWPIYKLFHRKREKRALNKEHETLVFTDKAEINE